MRLPTISKPAQTSEEPLTGQLLFHATPNRFRTFNTNHEGVHFGTQDQATNLHKHSPLRVITAEVRIESPLRVPDLGCWRFPVIHGHLSREDLITDIEADELWAAWLQSDDSGWPHLQFVLRHHGYDGFVYANEQEGPGDSYVAFYPEQIRILDHGTFNKR